MNADNTPGKPKAGASDDKPKNSSSNSNGNGHGGVAPKKGKKRRSLSCMTCRKLKTRCDFDSAKRMCHRCYMLRLPCSLMTEPPPHVPLKVEEDVQSTAGVDDHHSSISSVGDHRIEALERNMDHMRDMMTTMQSMMSCMMRNDNRTEANTFISQYDDAAPLVVIRDIDYKLFGRRERYEPVREASAELCAWINQHGTPFCDEMAQMFKAKCGAYMISNGTISTQTPLLAGMMILQGMRCDDKSTHDQQQPELFGLVRRVLSTSLMTSPLHMGDIEAMLYMAMYNPARKPKQPIFDSWLLTSYGIKMFMVSVPFGQVCERIIANQLHNDDMYLLRLWNNLCWVHLQYAIASGKPILVPESHLAICQRIIQVPERTGTDVNIAAEIALLEIQAKLQKQYPDQFDSAFLAPLDDWKKQFWSSIDTDPTKQLTISYEYCRIILAWRFLRRGVGDLMPAYRTAVESSGLIVRQFLDLSPQKIEGLPNHPLCILIYAVLTLCRYIGHTGDRTATLTLITRIYWYLYHIGDQPRDIVHSISNIIKSLVESANNSSQQQPPSAATLTTQTTIPMPMPPQPPPQPPHMVPQQQQQQQPLQPPQPPPQPIDDIPDISQYSTYDEFFEGVFSYMQNSVITN